MNGVLLSLAAAVSVLLVAFFKNKKRRSMDRVSYVPVDVISLWANL